MHKRELGKPLEFGEACIGDFGVVQKQVAKARQVYHSTQHFVVNDFAGERIIRRVTVMGDVVEGAEPPPWQPWVREGRLSATSRHDRQLYMYLKSQQGEAEA